MSTSENDENLRSADSKQSSRSSTRLTRSALRGVQQSPSHNTVSDGAEDLFLQSPQTNVDSPQSISTMHLSPIREMSENEWLTELLTSESYKDDETDRYKKRLTDGRVSPTDHDVIGFNDTDQDQVVLVWGTDLNIKDCQERFQQFILFFNSTEEATEIDENTDPTLQDACFYMRRLYEIHILETCYLDVDVGHINIFDSDLARQLVTYPQEVIPAFDLAVNKIYNLTYPDHSLTQHIQVRPYNSTNRKQMRSLDPTDIDQLVTVFGMVIRISSLIPEMRMAFFECAVCKSTMTVEVERGSIDEPSLCTHCNMTHTFVMIHNRSIFTDKQIVKLQESPDDMAAGLTPHTVMITLHNDLVDSVRSGDRVEVTGIFRAVSVRVNPKMRMVRSVHNTYVDAVHFRSQASNQLRQISDNEMDNNVKFTKERLDQIYALSQRDDIYELMADAIAPNIFENREVKKGILLQLFGGTKKDLSDYGRGHFRSEINVLLCGDPGTSKSQLLQYVFRLVPRSQYTNGKGTSAVGLTAYVSKDPETSQHVLQTGALVLADNGVCCIDEFDKMSESARSILHEVMEQQTLSIAKAGIICQLNARTSILAAANPVCSKWDKNKTIIENIQLPPTLLSRFDLIFLMLDPQDELYDRRLATHLVSLYLDEPIITEQPHEELDMELLRDYIAYAKQNIHPQLNEEASQSLIHAYVEMRQAGSGRGQICAYPRQLESLIRLAEAHAKARLSEIVEPVDVAEARRLHREALKQSSIDPKTGKIDVSILTTGSTTADRKRKDQLTQSLKNLLQAKVIGATRLFKKDQILTELRTQCDIPIHRDMFEYALAETERAGLITVSGQNIRLVN
ncbi:hypothetical protein GJ496_005734 [Pomphorhynchus laevis]|nr:hypothetical protein GJ496_005734 [Pomphorhynchus laevis]